MKEVRRYSDKTITLAARNIRRALKHIADTKLSKHDRVDLLVGHLVRQGLQPSDLARPSGADACVAIASMLRPSSNAIDTESYYHPFLRKQAKMDKLVVDSLCGTFDYKTPPVRAMPRVDSKGRGFMNVDYSDLETRIAARIAAMPMPLKLPPTWNRVVDRVMRMPGDA